MKKIILIVIIMAVSIMAFAKGGFSKIGRDRHFDHGDGDHRNQISEFRNSIHNLRDLDLTKEQKDKMEEILTKYRKEIIDFRSKFESLKIDERSEMRKGNFEKAKTISKKVSKIKEEISFSNIDRQKNIYNILTKEQQEKFKLERW